MRQIESGVLKPGDRLPPSAELAVALGAHPITVHKALRRLKMAGLVERTPRLGTFVRKGREEFRIAVVFGPSLIDESAYFYRALLRALRDDLTIPRCHCLPYDWINRVSQGDSLDDCLGFRHFRADQEDRPFSGLIGVGLADTHWERFRREAPGIAWARTGLRSEVHADLRHFGCASATWLLSGGARRLVYLRTLTAAVNDDVNGLQETVAARPGTVLRVEQWPERGPLYDESFDASFCDRLTDAWNRHGPWPDAILISDDVAMRGLAHALLARGAERVRSMRILSWGNRGLRPHYGLPVARYEVDLADYARALLMLVKCRSEKLPEPTEGLAIRGRVVEPEPAHETVPG